MSVFKKNNSWWIDYNANLLAVVVLLFFVTPVYAQGEVYPQADLKVSFPFGQTNSQSQKSDSITIEEVIDGDTLSHAIFDGNIKLVEKAIENGVDLEKVYVSYYGATPLVLAIGGGRMNIVKLLLEKGANPNSTISTIPLHHAIGQGNIDIIKILLNGGADPTIKNYNGYDAIGIAQSVGNQDIVRLLESTKNVYIVQNVIDGDTLKLSNGDIIRLIGIDAPESKSNAKAKKDSERTGQDLETITKMGQEATEFVKNFQFAVYKVEGAEVRLEFDIQKKDKYDRLLAYVFILMKYLPPEVFPPNEGAEINWKNMEIFLNASIVKSGYATPMTIPPNVRHANLFSRLGIEARENNIGLWEKNEIYMLNSSIRKTYYESGKIESFYEKDEDVIKIYHENGILKEEIYEDEGILVSRLYNKKGNFINGVHKEFHKNGNLMSEGFYKEGQLNGFFKYYDENGKLKSEENYKDSKRDGPYKSYFKNGNIWLALNYNNGIHEGLAKEYYSNSQLKEEKSYKNGRVDGAWTKYYKDGNLKEESNYKNNKMEGIYRVYYENSQLRREITFKDGDMVEQKDYYEDGKPKSIHRDGKIYKYWKKSGEEITNRATIK